MFQMLNATGSTDRFMVHCDYKRVGVGVFHETDLRVLFTLLQQIRLHVSNQRSYASCSKTHLQVYNSPLLIKRSNFHEPSGHSQDEKWEGAKVKARQLQSRNTWDKISRTDRTQRKMMACSSFRLCCKTFSVSLYMFLLHSSFKYKKECSLVFCIWLDESKPEMLNLHFAQC